MPFTGAVGSWRKLMIAAAILWAFPGGALEADEPVADPRAGLDAGIETVSGTPRRRGVVVGARDGGEEIVGRAAQARGEGQRTEAVAAG